MNDFEPEHRVVSPCPACSGLGVRSGWPHGKDYTCSHCNGHGDLMVRIAVALEGIGKTLALILKEMRRKGGE